MSTLIERLRKNCIWQRVKGTKLDNGYPYHKHLPDCDICQSADHMERLEKQYAEEIKLLGESEVEKERIRIQLYDLRAVKRTTVGSNL